jgi:hypothetical protein
MLFVLSTHCRQFHCIGMLDGVPNRRLELLVNIHVFCLTYGHFCNKIILYGLIRTDTLRREPARQTTYTILGVHDSECRDRQTARAARPARSEMPGAATCKQRDQRDLQRRPTTCRILGNATCTLRGRCDL